MTSISRGTVIRGGAVHNAGEEVSLKVMSDSGESSCVELC